MRLSTTRLFNESRLTSSATFFTGSDSEELVVLDNQREGKQSPSNHCRTWQLVFYLLAIASVFYAVFDIVVSLSHSPVPNEQDCACGSNLEEALYLGCKYDQLAAAWLPPHCIDSEISEQFERAGPGVNGSWHYYDDPGSTRKQLTPDQVGLLAHSGRRIWVTREWHVVHCIFYWQKMYRAKEGYSVLEARYDAWGHVHHCSEVIEARNMSMTEVQTSFRIVLKSGLHIHRPRLSKPHPGVAIDTS